MRRLSIAVLVLLIPFAAVPASASGRSSFAIPRGFRAVAWEKLGPGLDHVAMRANSVAHGVHVARLTPDAPYALRAVVSNQAIKGGLERTSSMCKRTGCLAGVNGDFFVTGGQPVGGLAIFGQALRSPDARRPQLLINGTGLSVGSDAWAGRITLEDGRRLTLDGVNVPLRGGKISLYTAAWGKTTGIKRGVVEIGVQIVRPRGPLVLGQEARIRFINVSHMGNAAIPADGAILAGEGAGAKALDALWWQIANKRIGRDATALVDSTTQATDSIGGAPVLLRDGRRAFTIVPRGLVQGRHPRTVVGWNRAGEVFLVTIDGRQPGHADGMTLLQTAEFMRQMGATDAINLDGGGSTTFVTKGGRVVNRPSDRMAGRGERAVANARGDRPEQGAAGVVLRRPLPAAPRRSGAPGRRRGDRAAVAAGAATRGGRARVRAAGWRRDRAGAGLAGYEKVVTRSAAISISVSLP